MPAIPVIGALAGPVAGALGASATTAGLIGAAGAGLSAAYGINEANKGINQQNAAASAAQNFANASQGPTAEDSRLQAYFNSDPAFLNEYNRVRALGDKRTPTQWLQGFLNENPSEVAKYQAFTTQNSTGPNATIPSSVAGPGGTVDLAAAQQAAQAVAAQNAANSAALEDKYNPGASQLRQDSLQALLDRLNQPAQTPQGTLPDVPAVTALPTDATNQALIAQLAAQAGKPLTAVGYDSPLTRAAIAQAQSDLALGGLLPQDVRNLVARNALARSGAVTGGLGLGRDITARDLGLTSLDLRNQRLQAALQAGGAEAALEGNNAAMRTAAEQFARNNLLQSQSATAANEAALRQADLARQQLALQAAQQGANNYFNQNSLLQNIASGDFARTLAATQLGQNIAQPQSGLDPGSIVNLAVGNVNQASNAQQQANALAAQTGQQKSQFGAQLIGSAIQPLTNSLTSLFKPAAPTATSYFSPAVFAGY